MLGERIRKLRKQKKLTLEALAGTELTKGMLSLIENNKAKPSMESLAYIARQLDVEVSDLLEEISTQEVREILEKAETLFNSDSKESKDKFKQLISLIKPYETKLSHGYESARLLDIYSRSLHYEKKSEWQEVADRAASMYDQMNLTTNRASIGTLRALDKFNEHKYSESLELFWDERSKIEAKHAFIDPLTQLDFDYYEAILYFAVGNSEEAIHVMENAITFSKEKRIFHRIDDLYRLAAAHAMMSGDEDKKEYYLKKLKQYSEFADDSNPLFFYNLLNLMTLISEKHEYNQALDLIQEYSSDQSLMEKDESWYYLEKGKALYGLGRFQEAIHYLNKVEIPEYLHHPFDLSIFYVKDSYKALAYLELGNRDEALQAAKKATEHFDMMPPTPYKEFSKETYEKVNGV